MHTKYVYTCIVLYTLTNGQYFCSLQVSTQVPLEMQRLMQKWLWEQQSVFQGVFSFSSNVKKAFGPIERFPVGVHNLISTKSYPVKAQKKQKKNIIWVSKMCPVDKRKAVTHSFYFLFHLICGKRYLKQ